MSKFGVRKIAAIIPKMIGGSCEFGICPVCESRTLFFKTGDWMREDYKCLRCRSSSRHRALAFYLTGNFPMLKSSSVYEPSPAGPITKWLKNKCGYYISSNFYNNQALGQTIRGFKNENLEKLTFNDNSFDIVITQDVFEHIEQPFYAFREIERVLKRNGSHVFTIPYYPEQSTETRVKIVNGDPVSEHDLEYHENPMHSEGSLVFTRFGSDLRDIIFKASGMTTTIHPIHEPSFGIEGESVIIFHSKKE